MKIFAYELARSLKLFEIFRSWGGDNASLPSVYHFPRKSLTLSTHGDMLMVPGISSRLLDPLKTYESGIVLVFFFRFQVMEHAATLSRTRPRLLSTRLTGPTYILSSHVFSSPPAHHCRRSPVSFSRGRDQQHTRISHNIFLVTVR